MKTPFAPRRATLPLLAALNAGAVLLAAGADAPLQAQTGAAPTSAATSAATSAETPADTTSPPRAGAAAAPSTATSNAPATAGGGAITVNIDGRTVETEPAPVLSGGAVLVPLRGVLEKLGAQVRYDASERRIMVTQGGKVALLRVGQNTATANASVVPLSSPPQLIGGSTYVPLRSLAELFGYRVQWIGGSRTVAIYSGPAGPRDYTDHRVALKVGGPLGITIDFHDATMEEVGRLLDAAKESGAGIIKTRFDWNTLEPGRGATFQWPVYDRVVREARQRGLIVTGVLGNSARWASVFSRSDDPNEWRNGPPRQSEFAAWENYVRRVVGRYGNDVHAWQIWERPSADKFRSGRIVYRAVLRAAAKAARESDPKAILYAGEPGGVDLEYIESLNSNGIAGITDGLAVYPAAEFQPGAPAAPEDFLRPFNLLRENYALRGAGARDFWVGGLSWPVLGEAASGAQVQTAEGGNAAGNAAGNADAPAEVLGIAGADGATRSRLLRTFTPQAQADYLMRASALALAAGSPKVFWSGLRDSDSYERVEPINPEFGSGLLRRDFTPRPSFAAFQTLARQVGNKPYVGALSLGPNAVALVFDNGEEASVAAWAVGGAPGGAKAVLNMTGVNPQVPNSIYIATRPDTQVLDATGNVLAGPEAAFELTARPIWITKIGYETRNAVKAQSSAPDAPKGVRLSPRPVDLAPDGGVAATFGAAGGEQGLYWRKFADFRSQAREIVQAGGRAGLMTEVSRDVLNPAAGRFFIFLDVDDEYLYFTKGTPVTVTVTVHRPAPEGQTLTTSTAGFNLQYGAPDGSKYTPWQVVEPGEGWATYTFEIPDATFANRGGFDLMINTFGSKRNLVFGGVTVRRRG